MNHNESNKNYYEDKGSIIICTRMDQFRILMNNIKNDKRRSFIDSKETSLWTQKKKPYKYKSKIIMNIKESFILNIKCESLWLERMIVMKSEKINCHMIFHFDTLFMFWE